MATASHAEVGVVGKYKKNVAASKKLGEVA
jgi:hypothetical protein